MFQVANILRRMIYIVDSSYRAGSLDRLRISFYWGTMCLEGVLYIAADSRVHVIRWLHFKSSGHRSIITVCGLNHAITGIRR
jgi:hypothetical protein